MPSTSGAIRAGRAFVEIFADDSKLAQGLRKAAAKLKAFGQSAATLGRSMLTTAAIAAFPIALATRTFREFDDEMRFVQATTQAVGDNFDMLTTKARLLGKTTSFTAQQVASAMAVLGRADFSPAEIDASIESILALSRATRTDLPTATDLASKSLRSFKMDASEMGHVVDLLVATVNNSLSDINSLAEGLRFVQTSAKQAGLSLQQTLRILGTLATLGLRGSVSGTSANQVINQLSRPEVITKLQSLGVQVERLNEATGKVDFQPIDQILSDFGRLLSTMGAIEGAILAKELFNIRGKRAGVGFAGATAALDALDDAFEKVTGTAKKASDAMDAGVGGVWRRLISAYQEMEISLGKRLEPVLMRYGTTIKETINSISLWISKNGETVISITNMILAIGALSAAILALGLAAGAVANLAFLLPLFATPMSAAIVVATALGLAIRGELLKPLRALNAELEITDRRTKRLDDLRKQLFPGGGTPDKPKDPVSPEEEVLSDAQKVRSKIASELTTAEQKLIFAKNAVGRDQAERQADAAAPGDRQLLKDATALFRSLVFDDASDPLKTAQTKAQQAVNTLKIHLAEADKMIGDAAKTNAAKEAARTRRRLNPILTIVQAHEDLLQKIRIQGMEDGLVKTLQLIDLEYSTRIRKAKEAGQDITALQLQQEEKVLQAFLANDKKKKQTQQHLMDEIAQLEIQVEKEGLDETLALIDQQEAQEIRDAKGKNEPLIRDKFNLLRELAKQDAQPRAPLQFAPAELGQRSNAAQAAWIKHNFGQIDKPMVAIAKKHLAVAEKNEIHLGKLAGKPAFVIIEKAIR